jgi:hypothetical protein
MRKPFWKSSHNCWYFKDAANRDTRLDPDEDTALDMWREMVQGKRRVGKDARVADLILRFLDWSKVNQADATYPNRPIFIGRLSTRSALLLISMIVSVSRVPKALS